MISIPIAHRRALTVVASTLALTVIFTYWMATPSFKAYRWSEQLADGVNVDHEMLWLNGPFEETLRITTPGGLLPAWTRDTSVTPTSVLQAGENTYVVTTPWLGYFADKMGPKKCFTIFATRATDSAWRLVRPDEPIPNAAVKHLQRASLLRWESRPFVFFGGAEIDAKRLSISSRSLLPTVEAINENRCTHHRPERYVRQLRLDSAYDRVEPFGPADISPSGRPG